MVSQEDKDEMRRDMLQDSKEEAYAEGEHEFKLSSDIDYAMEYYGIDKAYDAVMEVVKNMRETSIPMTYKEVLDYMDGI